MEMKPVKSITFPKPISDLQLGDTFNISFEGNDSDVKYTVIKIVTGSPSLGNAPNSRQGIPSPNRV